MSRVPLERIAAALERMSPAPLEAPDFTSAGAFVWHTDPDRLEPVARVARVDLALLVGIDRAAGAVRFGELASASFTRGTAITLHDGRQADIETLEIGTRVLTRDAGPQPVRWIGRSTLRATGAHAQETAPPRFPR